MKLLSHWSQSRDLLFRLGLVLSMAGGVVPGLEGFSGAICDLIDSLDSWLLTTFVINVASCPRGGTISTPSLASVGLSQSGLYIR